jgi:DNA-binding NtrC family response regulator
VALILLVDDEVQVARSIDRLLRRYGHQVRMASSGADALRMLDGVGLLLTDVRMPGMTGLELIIEVKRVRPAIRCCIMSGDPGAEGMVDAAPLVDARIGKPFTHDTLLGLIVGRRPGRDP